MLIKVCLLFGVIICIDLEII